MNRLIRCAVCVGKSSLVSLVLWIGHPAWAQTNAFQEYEIIGDTTTQYDSPASSRELRSDLTNDAPFSPDGAKPNADPAGSIESQRTQLLERAKQNRLQKIQSLSFDRRPSYVLRIWSEPPAPQPPDPDPHGLAKSPFLEGSAATGPQPPDPDPNGIAKPKPDPAAAEIAQLQEEMQKQLSAFESDLQNFAKHVALGEWDAVGHFLSELDEKEGEALYRRMIVSLRTTPLGIPADLPEEIKAQLTQLREMQMQNQQSVPQESNAFSATDVISIARVAPIKKETQDLASLATILNLSLEQGQTIQYFVDLLRAELAKPESDAALNRRQAAQLLFFAGHLLEAEEFLPAVDDAIAANDFEALNLLSRLFVSKHQLENKAIYLEQSWKVTQAVLASPTSKEAEVKEALRAAVSLAPKINEKLGVAWLNESFTANPQRGMEIIATIGASAAMAKQTNSSADARLQNLQLQTTAVEALLSASPELATIWNPQLQMLALNWLQEANTSNRYDTSTRMGSQLRRDMYGNFFYFDEDGYSTNSRYSQYGMQAIKTADVLKIKPSDQWLDLLNPGLRAQMAALNAQLYLKVGEDALAYPYVEQLATSNPEMAEDLVSEFLRVWTRNHDQNSERNRTSYYMMMYGYEQRAESIPLTRSKQARNLEELAELVKRLRALPLKKLDEQLLAKAFTTCHSNAEVYRLDAIEKVFGSLDELEPKTLAELAQQMRANLISVWRMPNVQKDAKTNRKQKDIEAEVVRGYDVAKSVVERGLQGHPDEWSLQLAWSSLLHDENNYQKELKPDAKFSENRSDSFDGFARAAELYAAAAQDLTEDEETAQVYEMWYYASLGACDLNQIKGESVPDLRQPERIRAAITALGGERAERHLAMFANSLFTRMSAINSAVKFRYLRGGFEIVGDHQQAAEAKKVFDYYKDLVTEIKLETLVDGADVVGHEQPFGVFVNIRHTREIERESNGFGRYLQNQNSGRSYYYNYGRPLENYRDKFEEVCRQSFSEHFEVLSVTFQSEEVNSRAVLPYGWRVTPYAYVLLKARGPEVDKLPSVRLDLDFLDTSGYVVIPIESPIVPIDASSPVTEPRPMENLKVTQILDERQADQGKLILEVKATALGLVPEFEQILSLGPKEFEIASVSDEGVSVSRFDDESETSDVISERNWMITLKAREDLTELPKTFQFAAAKTDMKELVFQRYVDADLKGVASEISLEEGYGKTRPAWIMPASIAVGGLILLLLIAWIVRRQRGRAVVKKQMFAMPEQISPFSVLSLLKQIQSRNGLDESGMADLNASINRLERYYFVDEKQDEPDLKNIAEQWVRRAVPRG